MASNNPLQKHFRQPSIYIKLPSNGKYYPAGVLKMSPTNELPVFPMTVKDEITLKTPDALLNGAGMAEVVKSCCPDISDPWEIPAVDLDPIFVAIRLASYGHQMDFSCNCPHCDERNEYAIDLRKVLDSIKTVDYSEPVIIDGLVFKFKPQRYKDMNTSNLIEFEEQRLVYHVINNDSITPDDKSKLFNESLERIRQLNMKTVVDSIASVTTEDGVDVIDSALISEFLDNASREVYHSVKDHIQKLIDANKLAPMDLVCENEECGKDFQTSLTFDQSSFFG